MLPNRTFDLNTRGQEFLSRKDSGVVEAINYYQAQSQADPDNLIYLALFLSLNNQREQARTTLKTALALAKEGQASLEEWTKFFEKYHQHHLVFTMCENAVVRGVNLRVGAALGWGKVDQAIVPFSASSRKADPLMKALCKLQNLDMYSAASDLDVLGERALPVRYYLNKLQSKDMSLKQERQVDSSWESYFVALFEKNKRRERFECITKDINAPKNLRVLAALALAQIDPGYVDYFIKLCAETYKDFYPAINNVEDNCVYAISMRFIHKQLISRRRDQAEIDKYQNIVRGLLTHSPISHNVLLPLAVPFYLRNAFMEVMLDKDYWPTLPLTLAQTDELSLIKEQYLKLVKGGIASGLDEDTRKNMAVQAICRDTTIGRAVNVAQGWSNTSFDSGTKKKFITFIEEDMTTVNDLLSGCLSESTIFALQKEDPKIFTFIKNPISACLQSLLPIESNNDEKANEILEQKRRAIADTLQPILKLASENKLDEACKMLEDLIQEKWRIDAKSCEIGLVGDYFCERDFLDLAQIAYSFYFNIYVPKIAGVLFATKQLARGFISTLETNRIKEAKQILQALEGLFELSQDYKEEAKRRSAQLRTAAYAHEPQGLHRLKMWLDFGEVDRLLQKARTTKMNPLHEFYSAVLSFVEGDLNAARMQFEKSYKELVEAEQLGIASDVVTHYLSYIRGYLGRIALIKKDAKNAASYFAEIRVPHLENQATFFIAYIKALLSLGRMEEVQQQVNKAQANEKMNRFVILLAHCLIAKKDKSHIKILNEYLASVDIRKQLSVRETAVLAVAYACLGEVAKVQELLRDSKIAPQYVLLNQLHYCQEEYLNLLVRHKYASEVTPDVHQFGLKRTKDSYVIVVKKTANLDLGFQALCPDTPVGRIFAIARDLTRTSFTSGSLKDMLDVLEKELNTFKEANAAKPEKERDKITLLPSTREAVLRLFQNNPKFFDSIKYSHPTVNEVCQECKEQSFSLFAHRSSSRPPELAELTDEQRRHLDEEQDKAYGL